MWQTLSTLWLALSYLVPRKTALRRPAFHRPCLERLEDRTVPSTFTVNTTADTDTFTSDPSITSGSLRDAINFANVDPDVQTTIQFAIGSPGTMQEILVGSGGLPAVFSHPTVIDGTSQSGPGYTGPPLIVLNGVQAGNASGLDITAGGSTVEGLVIQQFQQDGIDLLGPNGGNTVEGNYIGTDATGETALGNGRWGVFVNTSSANTIGGTTAGARNVISGNASSGVHLEGNHVSSGNKVQGNFIGTDANGTALLGNGIPGNRNAGVDVWGETGDIIGGTDTNAPGAPLTGAGNLISGNALNGINDAGSSGTHIQGNYIGTDVTGTTATDTNGRPLGNTFGLVVESDASIWIGTTGLSDFEDRNVISGNIQAGIGFVNQTQGDVVAGNDIGTDATGTQPVGNGVVGVGISGAVNNQIGGLGPLATTLPNTIAFNGGPGVWIFSNSTGATTGNSVQDNIIHDNVGLGIDLGGSYDFSTLTPVPPFPDGVTPNDSEGHSPPNNPNNFQDFPHLASATSSSTSTTISGCFREAAEPSTTLTLDFYANTNGSATTYGQGATYLGSRTVLTDATGNVTFDAAFALATAGQWISATATDQNGNTSEFSLDVQADSSLSQTFTQSLPAALPQSTTSTNTLTIQTNTTTINDVVTALSQGNLDPNNLGLVPVSVYLNLAPGTYTSTTVQIPTGMTLYINGVLGTTIDPVSPAFTVVAGNVVVSNVTFVTTGDAPTILVSGGSLTLRNDLIQESTGFNDAAISITGGTVNLGTATAPSGNTINVNGTGTFLSNTTANRVSDAGDTFESNGHVLVPLTVNTNSSLMLAGHSPPPLTGSVFGTPFVGSFTYTTPNGESVTMTLGTAATSTSPVGQYPITATLSGANASDFVIDPFASTVGTLYVVSVGADPSSTTGAQAVTFWDNKGNAKLITAADLTSLDALNLVTQGGAAFDPRSVAQLQAWLSISPNATTAYQLAVQLAALDLNVLSGYVKATDLVYAGGLLPYATADNIAGLTSGGFTDVQNLINDANAVLGLVQPGAPSSSDPNTAYEAALTQVFQAVNGNLDFVQQELNWNLVGLYLLGQLG
jgi:hypothetical protein